VLYIICFVYRGKVRTTNVLTQGLVHKFHPSFLSLSFAPFLIWDMYDLDSDVRFLTAGATWVWWRWQKLVRRLDWYRLIAFQFNIMLYHLVLSVYVLLLCCVVCYGRGNIAPLRLLQNLELFWWVELSPLWCSMIKTLYTYSVLICVLQVQDGYLMCLQPRPLEQVWSISF